MTPSARDTSGAVALPPDLDKRVLRAVTDVQDAYIAGRPPGDVFDELLAHVLGITDSEYGYIGEVLTDEGVPYLKAYAMTDISWDEPSRALYQQAREMGGFEFRNLATLFGAVLTTGRPVIANDAPNDPRAGGRMAGHLPLDRFLGLPLYSEGELVGSVGVSNHPEGYSEELVEAIRPFLATCGNLVRAFRVQRQLTASEEQRTAQEHTFGAVVDAAADGIVAFDGVTGEVHSSNPAARRLLGDDLEDRVLWDLVAAGSREELRLAAAHGQRSTVAVDVAAAGQHRRLEIALSGGIGRGTSSSAVAVLHDVTEQHEARAALEAAQAEAERTSQAKDEFLASMSHELRTPLNGVLGLAGLLASGQPGPLNERQAEFVALIESSGRHLLEVINDMLDLVKIQADQLQLDDESVALGNVVSSAIEMVAATREVDGTYLHGECDGQALVRGDERRLRQILLNLLSNAVKFTEGGEVHVTCQRVGAEAVVRVRDTGIGIAPERLEEIFEPFRQVDGRLSRQHTGTGLGLAVARRLAELHGGSLTAQSTPGEGSTFTLRLPTA